MNLKALFALVALVLGGVLPNATSRTIPPSQAIQTGQTSQASQASQSVAKPARAKEPVEIPFELANRHIILKVMIDGSRPLSFVLDTGDQYAIVSLDRAKELGLKLHGEVGME